MLYPQCSPARGTVVTRGFPLERRKGERVDRQHHAGLWLQSHRPETASTSGTTSDDITGERVARDGHHPSPSRSSRRRAATISGELTVESGMDRRRTARRSFASRRASSSAARATCAAIDRITHADGDRAEGRCSATTRKARSAFAWRASWSSRTANAEATVSGLYVGSAGKRGDCGVGHARPVDAAWRTHRRRARSRSPFSIIPATRAIRRIGTHAGYGLFAANPLGQKTLADGDVEIAAAARAWPVGDVPLSCADPERHSRPAAHRAGIKNVHGHEIRAVATCAAEPSLLRDCRVRASHSRPRWSPPPISQPPRL